MHEIRYQSRVSDFFLFALINRVKIQLKFIRRYGEIFWKNFTTIFSDVTFFQTHRIAIPASFATTSRNSATNIDARYWNLKLCCCAETKSYLPTHLNLTIRS